MVLAVKGEYAGAERLQREALAVRRRVFGPTNPESGFAVQSLASTLELQGRVDEAESLLGEAFALVAGELGDDNLRVASMAVDLARVRIAQGHAAGVEDMTRRALAVRERILPPGHWRIAEGQALLGASLAAQRRDSEAEALMTAADRAMKPVAGRQLRDRDLNRERLQRLRDRREPSSVR